MGQSAIRTTGLRGEDGADFITTTAVNNGQWRSIQAITACTFTTLTNSNCTPTACAAITLAAGVTIHGSFTVITLASGSVLAYK